MLVALYFGDQTLHTFSTAHCSPWVAVYACGCRWRKSRAARRGRVLNYRTVLFGSWAVWRNSLSLAPNLDLAFVDAVFESMSGLTTTGATVLVNLDDMPKSLLFYRQQLQWFGGMGIIVLAVAIFPMLGIGGMQLYRTESPGPVKDNKLTPRITETAKALWYIYLSLTVACALAYWYAGMSVFDAVSHSFATVAIGGFSTHDASIGFFNSPAIEAVACVFMVLSGVNFGLHFLVGAAKISVYTSQTMRSEPIF